MRAVSLFDLGVMAGGDGVKTQSMRALEEQVELDVSIALDARIRRLPGHVGRHEGSHDVVVELLGVVEHVMVDAEHLGHASRVIHVGDRTAS